MSPFHKLLFLTRVEKRVLSSLAGCGSPDAFVFLSGASLTLVMCGSVAQPVCLLLQLTYLLS